MQYMFSNICLMLALLTNAVIIGSATNLLSNMDAGAVAKKTQMDGINGYMRFRKARRLSAYLEQRLFSLTSSERGWGNGRIRIRREERPLFFV